MINIQKNKNSQWKYKNCYKQSINLLNPRWYWKQILILLKLDRLIFNFQELTETVVDKDR
jgi:hypothetical protein